MRESIGTATSLITAQTFDLGAYVLEVLEDQSILLMDQETDQEIVQLDTQESYRLLVALQSVFALEPLVEES